MKAWSCVLAIACCALRSLSADAVSESQIVFTKPAMRWLWGGFGFHNSEATMTPMMSEEFRDQRVLKTFREISPTFARVFAGYWNWTPEAMDRFADYYDATFRPAGTILYMAPGRMPTITEDFCPDAYAEAVASRLEYLIKQRKCVKIRYYTASNELSLGRTSAWFRTHWDVYVKVMNALTTSRTRIAGISIHTTDLPGSLGALNLVPLNFTTSSTVRSRVVSIDASRRTGACRLESGA